MKRKSISIKEKIKKYFFVNPTAKLRVRQIEKTLNLPLPSIIRYCKELKGEGILKTIKTGNIVFYTADRTNSKFLLEKRLFNIKQLYESGLINYLKEELSNPNTILFGSYSRGEDIENSDIDIYIETPSKKEIHIKKFEILLKRNIQVFRHKSIKEIKNKDLANNIINGIILNGFVRVFK